MYSELVFVTCGSHVYTQIKVLCTGTSLYAQVCCWEILACQSFAISKQWEAYDHSFRYCLSPFLSLLKSLVTSREERISFHLKNNHFCLIVKKQVVITNVCVYKSVRVSLCLYHNFKNTLFHGNWWKV